MAAINAQQMDMDDNNAPIADLTDHPERIETPMTLLVERRTGGDK